MSRYLRRGSWAGVCVRKNLENFNLFDWNMDKGLKIDNDLESDKRPPTVFFIFSMFELHVLPSRELTCPLPASTFELMIFLFLRRDMLVPWRAFVLAFRGVFSGL